MIRLKSLLEITDTDLNRLLRKIKNKQFKYIGGGDNGRVYEIDGEDRCFKITKEQDEFEVAKRIVDKWTRFTTFIPVYYVNDTQQLYIMANAQPIQQSDKVAIDEFMQRFAEYARAKGGEVSIFEFLEDDGNSGTDTKLINFLQALHNDIQRIDIAEFDLDLDFRSENVMQWNGNLVMVDW